MAKKNISKCLRGGLSRTKKTSRRTCSPMSGTRTEIRTAKLKLIDLTSEQEAKILETCGAYVAACNFVSQWVFDNGFPLSAEAVQRKLYYEVREKFGLPSQLTCCVFRTVTARYKTVKTQMERSPWVFMEDGMDEPIYINRDLGWLHKPICFKIPQCDQSRERSYRFLKGRKVSFSTMQGTVSAEYKTSPLFRELYNNSEWKMTTAKIEKHGQDWYVSIPFERKVAVGTKPVMVIGLDRGIVNPLASADEKRNIKLYNGDAIRRKRERFATTRAKLQSKGTRSAKRKLQSISGRENRWMSDVNHRLSKALVQEYGAGTLFVLENIVGVSKSAETNAKRNKKGRKELNDWSFFELETFITYKAEAAGSFALVVDAAYTSQRCPDCGKIDKGQRDQAHHVYNCSCGYSGNDDATAAINLMELGKAFLNGMEKPCFRKFSDGVVDASVVKSGSRRHSEKKRA